MATKQDIIDAVHDELVDVIATTTSVTTTDAPAHVRLARRGTEGQLPGFTIEMFEQTLNRGIAGGGIVTNITRDQNAGTADVTVTREKQATVDVAAHAADGNDRAVNTLYDAVDKRFTRLDTRYQTQPMLHDDVDNISPQGTQDVSSPDDNVRGDRYRINIEYDNHHTITDIPLIKTVNLTVGTPTSDLEEVTVFDNDV